MADQSYVWTFGWKGCKPMSAGLAYSLQAACSPMSVTLQHCSCSNCSVCVYVAIYKRLGFLPFYHVYYHYQMHPTVYNYSAIPQRGQGWVDSCAAVVCHGRQLPNMWEDKNQQGQNFFWLKKIPNTVYTVTQPVGKGTTVLWAWVLSWVSSRSYAWFPALRIRYWYLCVPFQKYITFIRQNSVAYVKSSAFSIAISLPFPFNRSNRMEFYFPFPFGSRYVNGNGATERQCGHDHVNRYGNNTDDQ